MTRCGCNPVPEQFEFEIPNINIIPIDPIIPEVSNIGELKKKIICEYLGILNNLECGIKPNLEFLLEEISLIWTKIYSTI